MVGVSGPDTSIKVPVSAMPAKTGVSAARSWPSLGPCDISSIGRPTGGGAVQGRPVTAGSGARRRLAGRFSPLR